MKRCGIIRVLIICLVVFTLSLSGCDFFEELFGGGSTDIAITSVSPETVVLNDTVTLAISGSGLYQDMPVKLINDTIVINAVKADLINGGQINAEFVLTVGDPMVMDVYIEAEDGTGATLTNSLTVEEYEVLEAPASTNYVFDISDDEFAYDFTNGDCVTTSSARDITIIYDADEVLKLTLTDGCTGKVTQYQDGFTSLEDASDLYAVYDGYAQVGDSVLPMVLMADQYYGVFNSTEPNQCTLLHIVSVDNTNKTVTVNFMIVKLMQVIVNEN